MRTIRRTRRWRISGTSTAARRLSNTLSLLPGRLRLAPRCRAGGASASRALPEKTHVAETSVPAAASCRSFAPPRIFTPSSRDLRMPAALSVRATLRSTCPTPQLVQVDDRETVTEMSDVARLLRITAIVRQSPGPRRLSAFERRSLTAARTHGLTLAAFATGLDHARTMSASDALALRPAAG